MRTCKQILVELLNESHYLIQKTTDSAGNFWWCPICSAISREENLFEHKDSCAIVEGREIIMGIRRDETP